ncbi:MAG: sigma-54 dependent transcriptional regulator [Bacteroidales bacterium]|jgi:DNA-binding NtrC family response regulator|nr:sigma-54 dependent transcriptional regulator [Bacteroidales bacterium]
MDKKEGCILVVDDDRDVLITARMLLKQNFSTVITTDDPEKIPSLLKKYDFDVVILDMNFRPGKTSGAEGLHWLKQILKIDSKICVLMNTAYGDIQIAVEAMKIGAAEFIVKPWEREKFIATVQSVYNLSKSKRKVNKLEETQKLLNQQINKDYSEIISRSKSMDNVFKTIQKVAATDANVLILGENGTGKELVAREIHRQSERSEKPFINVDLGAITNTLFESELFGHVRGAFTDAKEDKHGRFEIASGGTLFLDEIGNIPQSLQTKLLTAIQNKIITRVGSLKKIPVDIRLICATNRDLYQMAEQENFRQDLLYRINTVEINLPPLRERKEDIPLLANHFLNKFKLKYNKKNIKIQSASYKVLKDYSWPGNIRELMHLIERAVIMCEEKEITAEDFAIKKRNIKPEPKSLNVDEVEKNTIIKALEKNNKNYTKAANELGMGRSTLYRKMKKYGI